MLHPIGYTILDVYFTLELYEGNFPRKKYERKLKGKWCSKKKKKMLQYKTSDHMNQSATSRKVCHRKLDNYIALSRYIYIGAALRKP
jgi:hypothetical protein